MPKDGGMIGLRHLPNVSAHRLLPSLRRLPALAALLAVAVLACLPSTAAAEPDITMEKLAPETVLYGKESPVTLRVTNPENEPRGYNLTIRDVLPEGVHYVPGSATYG